MADLLCGWGMEKRGEISFMPQSYYVQFLNFYMCWWLVACAVHLNGNRKRHTIEYDCMCNEYFMHASQPANDRMSESCVCVQHIEVQIEIERWLAIFRFEIRRVPSHDIYIYIYGICKEPLVSIDCDCWHAIYIYSILSNYNSL